MTPKQKIELRQSEIRAKVAELTAIDDPTAEQAAEIRALSGEFRTNEERLQAIILTEPEQPEPEPRHTEDGESREVRELRSKVSMAAYVKAAAEQRGLGGSPESDYNAVYHIPPESFPLHLLGEGVEERAKVDGDAATSQTPWVDRVFGAGAARGLVTFRSVPSGVASVPVLTGGASAAQRGREEAVALSAHSLSVTELKPTRTGSLLTFSIEDAARLNGLEAALTRDLRAALADAVDKAIIVGDDGANEDGADIAGIQTITGIGEQTITQSNKVKGDGTIAAFADMVDGQYARGLGDLRVVATVGAARLWLKTLANSAAANDTLARFLRDNGLSWSVREGVETATTANKFAAFVGLARGIENAAVAAVWDRGTLVRDVYSGAAKGEVSLHLHYLWDFTVARTDNYKRLKFVA